MKKPKRLGFMKCSAPKLITLILCAAVLLCSCDIGIITAPSDKTASLPTPSLASTLLASTVAPSTPSPTPTDSPTPPPTPEPTPLPTPMPPVDMGGSPYYIYVEKGSHTVTIYGKDENFQYTVVVQQYIAAMGKTAGHTPTGKFKISGKRDRLHLFHGQNDTTIYSPYATPFYGKLYIHGPLYATKRNTSMI